MAACVCKSVRNMFLTRHILFYHFIHVLLILRLQKTFFFLLDSSSVIPTDHLWLGFQQNGVISIMQHL